MNLAELRSTVQTNLGGRDDLASQIDTWINWAIEELCAEWNWPELWGEETITTTAGTAEYSFSRPVIIYNVTRVSNNKEVSLYRVEPRLFYQVCVYPNRTGKPTHYVPYNKKIRLWRVPDGEYTIKVRRKLRHTPLVNDTDEPVLDEDKDALIVALATSEAFQALGEDERAAVWFSRYTGKLRKKIKEVGATPDRSRLRPGRLGIEYWKDPFVRRV